MIKDQKPTSRQNAEQSLPASRGFVVQIEANADVNKGQICGRIEHVVSGKSSRFYSIKDLLSFIESNI